MSQPDLRAADTDRARVADVLGLHMSAGRLTVEEYDERLARAYTAKTYGQLDALTADLPAVQPAGARPAGAPGVALDAGTGRPGWLSQTSPWAPWVTTSVIVTVIWLVSVIATGSLVAFWPIWVIGPWGAILLARTLTGGHPGCGAVGRDRQRDRRLH